ncbi:MAG TPA: exo-alpha-sialidase, partial [Acidobacteria bacterium]|nr:exo-alpha-sialidase [Acidobacteriota bacterium]
MANPRYVIGVAVMVIVACAGTVRAELPERFTQVWPPAGLTDLRCVAVAPDGTAVAGGAGPEILVSSDGGASWVRRQAPDPGGLRTLTWGDGKFLGFGASGKPMTSTDGVQWTVYEVDPAMDWVETVAWTGEHFVAAGGGCGTSDCEGFPGYAQVALSTDGSQWSQVWRRELYYGEWPDQMVSRNGVVVAGPLVNDDPLSPSTGVIVSTDGGTTWQVAQLGFGLVQLTAAADGFFALGPARTASGGGVHRNAAWSTDGVTWTTQDAAGPPGEVQDLTWTGVSFLAVTSSGTWVSDDGTQWRPAAQDPPEVRMRFGALATVPDGDLLGFGEQDTVVRLDRSGWQVVTTAGEPDLVRIASSGSRWVAVGSTWLPGMEPVLVSEDGQTWLQVPVPDGVREITDVVWTGERFLAAAGAVTLSSSDGLVWKPTPAPEGAAIVGLARDGDGIMAAGEAPGEPGGAVWWSEDGESWSRVASVGAGLRRIACNGGGLCVAVGWHGLAA